MRVVRSTVVAVAMLVGGLALGAAPAAAAVPTISVTPADGLVTGSPIAVTATGLTPGGSYVVSQCYASGSCQWDGRTPGATHTSGDAIRVAADGQGTVLARLKVRPIRGCDATPCSVAVFPDGSTDAVARTPITFAGTGTYQWPTPPAVLSAGDPAVEGSEVTVTASGLDPWSPGVRHPYAVVWQCRVDDDLDIGTDCNAIPAPEHEYVDPLHLDVDVDGTGSATFLLPRHLDLYGAPDYDCAREGCALVVTQSDHLRGVPDGEPQSVPIPVTYSAETAPWPSPAAFVRRALVPVRASIPSYPIDEEATAEALASRELEAVTQLIHAGAWADTPYSVNRQPSEVVRAYRGFFGRAPETAGLTYWVQRLRTGTSLAAMGRAFGGTPEFRRQYGGVSNTTVVQRAYRNTLGREGEPSGVAYWVDTLDKGMARSTLLLQFARSAEMRNLAMRQTALATITFTLAGRAPTPAEVLALGVGGGVPLSPGYGIHEVVAALVASGELLG